MATLQIRHRDHATTFLRGYLPHGQIKKQKILTLLTQEFGVTTKAIERLLAIPSHQSIPLALGRGNAGSYSAPSRRSMRTAEEHARLKESDNFLASQWHFILLEQSHRAPWSH